MKSGFVAIIGQPNVGKSTLLNRFIGEELAIVTPKPQTTRQKIMGIYNRDGAQAVFIDTPGFHESKKAINKYMLEKIDESLADADVVVLVVEPKKRPDEIDFQLFEKAKKIEKRIIAINKRDTIMDEPWGRVVDRYWEAFEETPVVAIAASNGDGCTTLIDKIVEFLPEGEAFYPPDQFTEHPVRFLASEIIREQAMLLLRQEPPYSMAVEIDEFKEPEVGGRKYEVGKDGLTRIRASIVVEKESQKAIVIGSKAEMIKKIGTLAREKIEALVGTKVYLELFVKVVKDWTKDKTSVRRFM